jgi:hypothetical protein
VYFFFVPHTSHHHHTLPGTEEVFLLACEACLAMNIHYSERSQNHFMIALMAAKVKATNALPVHAKPDCPTSNWFSSLSSFFSLLSSFFFLLSSFFSLLSSFFFLLHSSLFSLLSVTHTLSLPLSSSLFSLSHTRSSSKENQHFGEALTWILNKQSAPYTNGPLLKQSLNALQDLFSDDSSSAYFYTNDLKVLVDIFVREITNLGTCALLERQECCISLTNILSHILFFVFNDSLPPPPITHYPSPTTHHSSRSPDTKDVMRTDYLMTLSLLLNRSSWVEHGRYRREDIAACLESILDVGGDGVDGYEETALETVEIVLDECAAILEA